MYLLDTNHCARIIEGDSQIIDRFIAHQSSPAATCVIVHGELLFMAHHSQHADRNLARMTAFLNTIEIVSIDGDACDQYGRIKTAAMERWGPRERARRRHFDLRSLGFSDNDLWIAAIAIRHQLIVVSSDRDFERIAEVSSLRFESWLTEKH